MTVLTAYASTNPANAGSWSNPTNAYAEDGTTYATRAGTSKNTWYDMLLGFDLSSLPSSGISITSVVLTAAWRNSAADTSGPVLELSYLYDGVRRGTATTDTSGQTSNEVVTVNDGVFTPAELRATGATGFVAKVNFRRTDNTAHTASVDYVKVVITYEPISDTTVAASIGAPTASAEVEATTPAPPEVKASGLLAEFVAGLAKLGVAAGNNSDPTSAWENLVGGADAALTGSWPYTTSEGWAGAGTAGDPYRLKSANNTGQAVSAGDIGAPEDKTFTHEIWAVYPSGDTAASNYLFNESQDASDTGAQVGIRFSGGSVSPVMNSDSGSANSDFNQTGFNDGSLHHFVLTGDGTTMRFYIDGTERTTGQSIPSGTYTITNSRIGGRKKGTTLGSTVAAIATVRVYDHALSLSEIGDNYDAGVLATSGASALALSASVPAPTASVEAAASGGTPTSDIEVAASVPAPTAAASAAMSQAAAVSASVPAPTAAASAGMTQAAAVAGAIPSPSAALAASMRQDTAVTASVGAPTAAAQAATKWVATVAASVPAPTASAAASMAQAAAVSAAVPAPTASASASMRQAVAVSASVPAPTAAAEVSNGTVSSSVAVAAAVPAPTAAAQAALTTPSSSVAVAASVPAPSASAAADMRAVAGIAASIPAPTASSGLTATTPSSSVAVAASAAAPTAAGALGSGAQPTSDIEVAASIAAPTANASASTRSDAGVAAGVAAPTASVAASATTPSSSVAVSASIPAPTASASAAQRSDATIAASIPAPTASATSGAVNSVDAVVSASIPAATAGAGIERAVPWAVWGEYSVSAPVSPWSASEPWTEWDADGSAAAWRASATRPAWTAGAPVGAVLKTRLYVAAATPAPTAAAQVAATEG